jgi:hypothetical protein
MIILTSISNSVLIIMLYKSQKFVNSDMQIFHFFVILSALNKLMQQNIKIISTFNFKLFT